MGFGGTGFIDSVKETFTSSGGVANFFQNFKDDVIDEYPLYCIIALAVLVLLVVAIVAIVVSKKKKKKAKNAAEAGTIEQIEVVSDNVSEPSEDVVEVVQPTIEAEEPSAVVADEVKVDEPQTVNLAKDSASTEASDEWKPVTLATAKKEEKPQSKEVAKPVEEYDPFKPAVVTAPKKSAPKAEPKVEVKEEPKVEVKEEPKKKPVKAEKPAVTKKAEPKAQPVAQKEPEPAVVAPIEEPVKKEVQKDLDAEVTAATVSGKKVVGKYVIDENEDFYQFSLYANNGQLLYESREYATLATCKSGIATFKKNVAECDYRVAQDKNGNWKYIFRKGNSIYIGESYSTEQSAINSAESTKRFAEVSELLEK